MAPPVPGSHDDSISGLVSVVLACYNEELALAKVVDDTRAALDAAGVNYEIVVVDDGSSDRTSEIAREKGARLVRHPINIGSGAARRTGIIHARGEIVVMLDADGTYEPKTIPEMLKFFPEYEQVNGARLTEEGTLKALRVPAKFFIRQLAIYISGRKIPDLNTGLKAFRRDTMLRYLWVMPDGFSCVTTMTLAFMTNGHPVAYVDTPYYARIGKSKFHPIKDTIKYVGAILRIMTFFRPMRIYMPAAAFLLFTGFAKSAFDLLRPMKHSLEESDIILLCVGFLMGGLGLLAELIVSQRRS